MRFVNFVVPVVMIAAATAGAAIGDAKPAPTVERIDLDQTVRPTTPA